MNTEQSGKGAPPQPLKGSCSSHPAHTRFDCLFATCVCCRLLLLSAVISASLVFTGNAGLFFRLLRLIGGCWEETRQPDCVVANSGFGAIFFSSPCFNVSSIPAGASVPSAPLIRQSALLLRCLGGLYHLPLFLIPSFPPLLPPFFYLFQLPEAFHLLTFSALIYPFFPACSIHPSSLCPWMKELNTFADL